ncbi:MAG: hypothetical protein M1823_008417, partial [Watsoniomyces obsoletus]
TQIGRMRSLSMRRKVKMPNVKMRSVKGMLKLTKLWKIKQSMMIMWIKITMSEKARCSSVKTTMLAVSPEPRISCKTTSIPIRRTRVRTRTIVLRTTGSNKEVKWQKPRRTARWVEARWSEDRVARPLSNDNRTKHSRSWLTSLTSGIREERSSIHRKIDSRANSTKTSTWLRRTS